jgi:hypothetical protein
MKCSLCNATGCIALLKDRRRTFYFCKACELLFVPAEEHISLEDEKKRYDLHDNSSGNRGYVQFLEEIVGVIEERQSADQKVLDFGSGKNAVLCGLLQRKGFSVDFYDPLYALGKECLSKKYDILVLCEVIEHMRNLKDEIRIIKKMLDKSGKIIVRTNIYPSREEFRAWWYKEDMTHINFFSRKSIELFALKIGFKLVEPVQKDIFVLHNKF